MAQAQTSAADQHRRLKRERLAAALRENLKRRKAQQRGRKAPAEAPGEADSESDR